MATSLSSARLLKRGKIDCGLSLSHIANVKRMLTANSIYGIKLICFEVEG